MRFYGLMARVAMEKQGCLDQKDFQKLEDEILKQVLDTSKAILESFKFTMIYGTRVSPEQEKKTSEALKEFRSKNWDADLDTDKAYGKYANS
jgi:energy-converting hydrogenase A subunit M